MPNIEILQDAMQFIIDHPEQHRQDVWTCNTGACLAGHVTLLNGYRALVDSDGVVVNGFIAKDGDEFEEEVWPLAQELLGIDSRTADILFSGGNTAEVLQLMVKDIANGERLIDHWVLTNTGCYRRVGDDDA